MTYLIVLALYFGVLFLLAWASRRHLGVASLGLAAGALLASLWTDNLTPLIAKNGLIITHPPLTSVVAVALTLLPAILLMMRAQKASSKVSGVVESLLFAALGVMLTYSAFQGAVVLDDQSKQYISVLVEYQNVIITVGVLAALLSILFYKKPRLDDKKKSRGK